MGTIVNCNVCGAKIEIEDSDSAEQLDNTLFEKEELSGEVHLCENCAHHCD